MIIAPVIAEFEDRGLMHFAAQPVTIARRANGLGYLASPVTRRIAAEQEAPWHIVERLSMECAMDLDALAAVGVCAVSPALQALEMIRVRGGGWTAALHGPRGALDQARWRQWCWPMLSAASFIVVADRPGWRESEGIAAELRFALGRNVPVFFMGLMPSSNCLDQGGKTNVGT